MALLAVAGCGSDDSSDADAGIEERNEIEAAAPPEPALEAVPPAIDDDLADADPEGPDDFADGAEPAPGDAQEPDDPPGGDEGADVAAAAEPPPAGEPAEDAAPIGAENPPEPAEEIADEADDPPAVENEPAADEAAPADEGAPPAETPVPDPQAVVADLENEADDEAPPTGPAPLVLAAPVLDDALLARLGAADLDEGRREAQPCVGCHSFQEGGQGRDGPQLGPILFDVFGREIAAMDGFDYSPAFLAVNDGQMRWTAEMLDAFLADPEAAIPGTAMSYAVADADERAGVIVFLRSLSNSPLPLDADAETAAMTTGEGAALLERIAAADIAQGEIAASRCSACHRFAADAQPLTGPNLFAIIGAEIAAVEGFDYSPALTELGAEGGTWSYMQLDAFLQAPAIAVPGTRMGFGGIADDDERAAVIAYLRTLADEPVPLSLAPTPAEPEPERIGVFNPDLEPLAFSRTQADFGDRYFGQFGCDACHGARLQGVIDIRDEDNMAPPALVGANFERRWFNGSVYELFAFMSSQMPPDSPGGLEELFYTDILSFILEQNGFRPSSTILPTDRDVLSNMGFYQ